MWGDSIKFTKMQGLGNDYIYLDCTREREQINIQEITKKISNRHFGIGSDGVILICPSKIADFKMKMYNADGSEAQMCGNGIRCVGKYVYDKGLTNKTQIDIETLAGVKQLELQVKNQEVENIKVDMGKPILKPEEIPLKANRNTNILVQSQDKKFKLTCISMGNPHAITIVEKLEEFDVEKYGKNLENNPIFPQKANIEFVQIINKNKIKMRVWERGSGETLACGTGACASVVACYQNQLTSNQVEVELLGGNLEIEWNKKNHHVYMIGPAKTVFEGEIKEEDLI